MSNIGNYSNAGNIQKPIGYAKINSNTQKVQKFAEYLHEFLPVLVKEFDDLEELSKTHANEVFPLKMQALNDIYNASQVLYEWYVVKAKTKA